MCGRFSLAIPLERLREIFLTPGDPVPTLPAVPVAQPPRYNICPTQAIPVIRRQSKGSGRRLDFLHWGLIPAWAREPNFGSPLINARAETMAEKPSFRTAFRQRRCLVPADGFFEWKKGGKGQSSPFLIRFKDQRVFAFAGLWEHWQDNEGKTLESCTIITTTPNPLVKTIHNRMPVILGEDDYTKWLTLENPVPTAMLKPFPDHEMIAFPVSKAVNRTENDSPECLAPVKQRPTLFD